jgi:hypothetical protein
VIPPVLVLVVLTVISLTLAAIKQRPFERDLWKPYHWLVLTHLFFFPAVIVAGVIWSNPVTNPTIPHPAIETGRRFLDLLWYASIASCVWWVWRMRGFRWFAPPAAQLCGRTHPARGRLPHGSTDVCLGWTGRTSQYLQYEHIVAGRISATGIGLKLRPGAKRDYGW